MQSEYDGTKKCEVNTMEQRNAKWIRWNKEMQSEYDETKKIQIEYDRTEKCKVNTMEQRN